MSFTFCTSCHDTDEHNFDRRPNRTVLYRRCRRCRAGQPTHRWCRRCEHRKNIDQFHRHGRDGYQSHCIPCKAECIRQWRADNPRAARAHILKYKSYGIDIEDYEAMLLAQRARCAICGCTAEEAVGTQRWLAVDHCHRTGKVRALLCGPCNGLLGMAQDDVLLLEKAIAYLETHR